MALPSIHSVRRRLAARSGLVPAAMVPPASHGRAEQASISPATLIESGPVAGRAVGTPVRWPGPVAFLDGTQRIEVVAYAGTAPLLAADVAAAVRERVGRDMRTATALRRVLLLGRPEAISLAGNAIDGVETVSLDDAEPAHPLRDIEAARQAVDAARGEVERQVGDAYRRGAPHWLVVDGSLAESPSWARDGRMIGVSKSHATLPFEGSDLVTYLQLPAGHRSSIFQPASRRRAPVYAWGLRLWPWAEQDLLYGLVRVEAAPEKDTLDRADEISRWLLAERAPISAPDSRWDRLLYGIHGVEEYLRVARGER
jgi:hypothetical protein